MATTDNSVTLKELQDRMEWLDGERRKTNRKLAEVEQQFALQERELHGREQRIQELEGRLTGLTSQLNRLSQIDTQLDQFKDELVALIEQYDQRRIKSEGELDRLRRIEHENTAREIADIRKELPGISRLQHDMELRQAEESRLANLIGSQKGQISLLNNKLEEWERNYAFIEEKERQNNRNIADIQTNLLKVNKRWNAVYERLDALHGNIARLDTTVQPLTTIRDEIYERMESWANQIQLGEHERNKQLENWRYLLDEHSDTINRFAKEWVTFSDQYKEAKMALQTMTEWQKQIEQQQREANESLRIETHRMQSRWDNFVQEIERRLKSYEVETEQRWHMADRQSRQTNEQFLSITELLEQIEQDRDLMWRVQTAQADALKKFPLIWLEEIEKARKQDPNRRRQPAFVPVREE
ncbi:MAG: hypothetical protein H6662_09080 [Ardenticatenaceae bacterium]|nr:hypothetical protein [Anaerolineales bacterium]MCB8921723.1 hypothetical protein [Ardenticatenaceae bacterium]MCB8990758.1 hypothetical protein [Ardenticatenaceae bacterium]MCB9003245.1 hypothetical protein [Ardenticatenaceae bacterium]